MPVDFCEWNVMLNFDAMIKGPVLICLMSAVTCVAQLMPAKKPDSVTIDKNVLKYNSTMVSPRLDASPGAKGNAVDDATDGMRRETFSTDSTTGTLIGLGAEFVGGMIKDRISPDSYETKKANLELKREHQWPDARNTEVER